MTTPCAALARTTLLINRELFAGNADERSIADGLLATTVRFTADEESVSCRAGQTALVTAFTLTARLGISIELAFPNVPVVDRVAPLRLGNLVDALVELGRDLVPGVGARTHSGAVDEAFAFGSPALGSPQAVSVAVSDFATVLERDGDGAPCLGSLPFGGFMAGAAVAAIALDAAVPRIEGATGLPARRPRPSPGPPVHVDLSRLFPDLVTNLPVDLDGVDAVSGGAITHALVFCLLRVPGLRVRMRVIEEQHLELSNINRYAVMRASDEGTRKTQQLESAATSEVEIQGATRLFTKRTRGALAPLARRVVVGVDDVEARWWVQEENPGWLAVGATGNHLAQLTTHLPDTPCAGCVHAEPLPPETIPTISFVSFWAGLLQACALVSGSRLPHNFVVYPFALGGLTGIASFNPVSNPACPIGCSASRQTDGIGENAVDA